MILVCICSTIGYTIFFIVLLYCSSISTWSIWFVSFLPEIYIFSFKECSLFPSVFLLQWKLVSFHCCCYLSVCFLLLYIFSTFLPCLLMRSNLQLEFWYRSLLSFLFHLPDFRKIYPLSLPLIFRCVFIKYSHIIISKLYSNATGFVIFWLKFNSYIL